MRTVLVLLRITCPESGSGKDKERPGKVWDIEEELYPRAKYWDKFARSQSSLCIHFTDFPSLAKFNCPEGSHLDYREVPAFSSKFARLLKVLQVF